MIITHITMLEHVQNSQFVFLGTPLGDPGATYDDHLMLIRKCVMDFLLVLTELFFARCYD